MTFSYKPKRQLIPKRFNFLSFFILFVFGSLYLLTLNLTFLFPPEKERQERDFPSSSKNLEISFEQIASSPPIKESFRQEKNPQEGFLQEERENIREEEPINPRSEEKESSHESTPSLSPKQEKKIIDEIAYELSRTFNSVKYYSPASKKEKQEGESLLLVKISEKGDIIEVKRQDNLLGSLSHDLDYSIEKLKKNWRGKNKTKKELTLQMKVIYKLI